MNYSIWKAKKEGIDLNVIELDFKQTFFWADEDNAPITRLEAFADAFLEKCFVSKMIAKYVAMAELASSKIKKPPISIELWSQVRALDAAKTGAGLGLPIAKAIVEGLTAYYGGGGVTVHRV